MALKINRKLHLIASIAGWVLLAILAILAIKIKLWENHYYEEQNSKERSPEVSVITKVDVAKAPNTTEVSEKDVDDYIAPDTNPLRLIIDRLDIRARIYMSQTDSKSTLPVPSGIYDTMWYSGSARPGEGGVVVISGLSGYGDKDGVFANLEVLEKGDEIIVETGRHDKYVYKVSELSIVNKNDSYKKLSKTQQKIDDSETLSLITARAENTQKDYDSITFVRAKFDHKIKAED